MSLNTDYWLDFPCKHFFIEQATWEEAQYLCVCVRVLLEVVEFFNNF